MISLVNYTKKIKNNVVLDSINCSFEEGKAYLLTGHNGCGKTMLLRSLCGLIAPTKGTLAADKNYSFGVVIETPNFMNNETALYNLKYLANIKKNIGIGEIENALKSVNLFDFRLNKVKSYSLGMKQRLGICQAIMEDPDIILLDEPFNALDDENYKMVVRLISKLKDRGKIVIIAAHGVDDVSLFDSVIKMNNGKIVL